MSPGDQRGGTRYPWPMNVARGLVLAFGVFAASFALHIVGGASGQDWLFNLAVALIFLTATAFPVIALLFAGSPRGAARNLVLNAGFVIGTALTASAFWAANGRGFAWWEVPAAAASVLVVSVTCTLVLARLWSRQSARVSPRPASFRGKEERRRG